MVKKVLKTIDRVSIFTGILTGVVICVAFVIIIAEIILRSVFSSTMYVAEEYTGYLMAVLSFMGLSYCLFKKGHIRMSFIQRICKGKAGLTVDLICYFVGTVFSLFLTYVTFVHFMESVACGTRSMQISETPLAIPQFFMPLGSGLFALQFLAELIRTYLSLKENTNLEAEV